MWRQVRGFNTAIAGTTKYLCLANVRKGYGIAAKHAYALLDWQNNIQHKDRNFPAGVAVPVYFNWTGTVSGVRKNYGHIAVRLPDGRVWTDGRHYGNVDIMMSAYLSSGGPSYLGWGELVNNVRVVEYLNTPTGGGEDMIKDTDNEYARWQHTTKFIRARLSGDTLVGLSRQEFRNSAVGQTWLKALEILEDDTEANAALEKVRQGAIAVRDDWIGQIQKLVVSNKAKDAEIAKLKQDLANSQSSGNIDQETKNLVKENNSILKKIWDAFVKIFKV